MKELVVTFFSVFILFTTQACSQKQIFKEEMIKDSIQVDGKFYKTVKGYIKVNEDYSDVNSKNIYIPYFIVKSSSKSPLEPIFWLDGGPGGSNIISEEKIQKSSSGKLLENHDFVCIGYRGVDGSTVLESKDINKAMKGLDNELLSEKSLKNIENEIKNYTQKLKNDGIEINNYNILSVIDDLEYVRKFLGYKSIILLSVSYGTRVALLYGYKYPQIIKKTLMIGACPPNYFLARPEQAEKTIQHYDSLYQANPKQNTRGSIQQAMKIAFQKMPKKWSLYKLDKDKIKAGTISALYSRGFAVVAFDAYFNAAYDNDYSGLFMLQKVYDMNQKLVIGDAFAKAVSADINSIPSKIDDSTILGENVSAIQRKSSPHWGIKSFPEEYTKCRLSEVPILIVSGDLDFRTPAYITQKELMPYLKNGKHIILKNMSHADILGVVMQTPEFLYQYFDNDVVDDTLIKTKESIDFTPQNTIGKAKIFAMGILY